MSIADAIAALSPNLWYKLDEGSGTTANNSGSLSHDGTVSGTVDWTVAGPEQGTTAMRLYSDGQIVSGGMDLTAVAPVTMGLMVAVDASGLVNTDYPLLGIGDVSNRLARGPLIYERHITVGNPQYFARWNTGSTIGVGLTEPRLFWKWIVVTLASGAGNTKLYINGSLASSSNISSGVACLDTDPLLLKSQQAAVVAHVVFWNGVLTQSDIQTVSDQMPAFPYAPPINTQPTGGGTGGGLTEEQAEQLGQIDAKTDDLEGITEGITYISGKVNEIDSAVEELQAEVASMQGKLDESLGHLNTLLAVTSEQVLPNLQALQDAVTREFINLAGIGLMTPIGHLLAHPDPNVLHETTEDYVISGRGTLTPPGPLNWGNVYGVRWTATTVPPRAGLRDGVVVEFFHRLVQWVLWYPDQASLELHAQEIESFTYWNFTYLWKRPYPSVIQYDIQPGFELTVKYIILAPDPP